MNAVSIEKAATIEVGRLNQPVVTLYQIAVIIFRLYQTQRYKSEQLEGVTKTRALRSDCLRIVRKLERRGILEHSKSVRHAEVYSVMGREQGTAGETACAIDPFAYLSHLSAMEWHGLTDRIARILFYSSPPPGQWRKFAWERMKKEIGEEQLQDYLTSDLPPLRRLGFNKIARFAVHRYLSEHLGAFISVQGRCLRVSTIGRTFLDMIRQPDLCGGIYHILDVYEQSGRRYFKLIVDEIDRHGTKIDKVRAGYILDERMGISEPRIEHWKKFAQRGGSRKLYASNPYSAQYSEKWCLSINVEV